MRMNIGVKTLIDYLPIDDQSGHSKGIAAEHYANSTESITQDLREHQFFQVSCLWQDLLAGKKSVSFFKKKKKSFNKQGTKQKKKKKDEIF